MAGRYCEGKIKMASEKVSRKMVLEIKYINANNAVIHTENLVTGILAKISLGTGIWAKFRLGTGIWYPPSRPSLLLAPLNFKSAFFAPEDFSVSNLPLQGLTIRRSCVCCSVCMRNGLRFTDSKHCFADDVNTALHECFSHNCFQSNVA